jgi:hypothetical protein
MTDMLLEDMPHMRIVFDAEGAFPELAQKEIVQARSGITVSCLPAGMVSGKPSVSIMFDLPDGRVAFIETSLALFLSAADAFKARHGDPRR